MDERDGQCQCVTCTDSWVCIESQQLSSITNNLTSLPHRMVLHSNEEACQLLLYVSSILGIKETEDPCKAPVLS